MKLRNTVFGIAAGIAVMLVSTVLPASAKSISHVPASCSASTAGYGIFLQQGSLVTLGFGADTAGTWHILVGEAGATPIVDSTFSVGPAWTFSGDYTMPAGLHVVSISANNLTTGESCTSGVSFLVAGGGGGGGVAAGQPDIQLAGSSSTANPAPGATYSYTYQIKNAGTASASAVQFLDILPSELPPLSFQGVTTSNGTACSSTLLDVQIQVLCDFGTMAVGAQTTVTIVVSAPLTPGTYANLATAYPSPATSDKNLGNNDKTISVTVR